MWFGKCFKKRRVLVVTVAIFVLGGVIWQMNVIPRLNQRYQEYKVLSEIERLEDAYRQDTYGGATPEETLEMFLVAFMAGDLDLASKYFMIEKQAEYLAKMQNWVKLGKGEEIARSLENSQMLGELRVNSFMANIGEVDKEGNILHSIEFWKNKFTDKWKLNNM